MHTVERAPKKMARSGRAPSEAGWRQPQTYVRPAGLHPVLRSRVENTDHIYRIATTQALGGFFSTGMQVRQASAFSGGRLTWRAMSDPPAAPRTRRHARDISGTTPRVQTGPASRSRVPAGMVMVRGRKRPGSGRRCAAAAAVHLTRRRHRPQAPTEAGHPHADRWMPPKEPPPL
jgi:hypothetical protein